MHMPTADATNHPVRSDTPEERGRAPATPKSLGIGSCWARDICMTTPAKVRHGSAMLAVAGWRWMEYTREVRRGRRHHPVFYDIILYTLQYYIADTWCVYYCNERACGEKIIITIINTNYNNNSPLWCGTRARAINTKFAYRRVPSPVQ